MLRAEGKRNRYKLAKAGTPAAVTIWAVFSQQRTLTGALRGSGRAALYGGTGCIPFGES